MRQNCDPAKEKKTNHRNILKMWKIGGWRKRGAEEWPAMRDRPKLRTVLFQVEGRYRAETASIGITDLPAAGLELNLVN